MLFKDHNQETLENKISKGKFSLKDRLTLNGMEGDSRVLTKLVDKIWPDGLDLSSNGRPLLIDGTKDEEDDE